MATPTQIANLKLRQPDLSPIVSDAVVDRYLDDAALEMSDYFNIGTTDPSYDKLLSLYALHLMFMSGILKQVTAGSVKDVSETYANAGSREGGSSVYYDEFMRSLRRRKFPPFVYVNS